MSARRWRASVARLFRPGEWTVEITKTGKCRSADHPAMAESIQAAWDATEEPPGYLPDKLTVFLPRMAEQLGCEFDDWRPREDDLPGGGIRVH